MIFLKDQNTKIITLEKQLAEMEKEYNKLLEKLEAQNQPLHSGEVNQFGKVILIK